MASVTAKLFKHLNGNKLCVVDCETTGETPGFHDLIQICVLPLTGGLQPDPAIMPFYQTLIPKRPENWDAEVKKLHPNNICDLENVAKSGAVCDATLKGTDPDKAADLFDEWWQRLGLAYGKRISPLAQNWPFDRGFLLDWLGPESFKQFFDPRYRDTMVSAAFLNDWADWRTEPEPHAHLNLRHLAKVYEVPHDRAHDALADCLVTAEVYRRMLMRG